MINEIKEVIKEARTKLHDTLPMPGAPESAMHSRWYKTVIEIQDIIETTERKTIWGKDFA